MFMLINKSSPPITRHAPSKRAPGFTLVELLLVVALVAILGAVATPFLSRFVLATHFDAATEKIISTLRKAQGNAMNGKNDAAWGACVTGTTLRLYATSCGSPTIMEDFTIPGTVSIVGLSDTTFNRRGEPSQTLSITVSTSIETTTITLNQAGGLTF